MGSSCKSSSHPLQGLPHLKQLLAYDVLVSLPPLQVPQMSLWLFPTMIVTIDLILDTIRVLRDDTRVMVTLMAVKIDTIQVPMNGLLREGVTIQDHSLLKAGNLAFMVTSARLDVAINPMDRKKKARLMYRRTIIGLLYHRLPLNTLQKACGGN